MKMANDMTIDVFSGEITKKDETIYITKGFAKRGSGKIILEK